MPAKNRVPRRRRYTSGIKSRQVFKEMENIPRMTLEGTDSFWRKVSPGTRKGTQTPSSIEVNQFQDDLRKDNEKMPQEAMKERRSFPIGLLRRIAAELKTNLRLARRKKGRSKANGNKNRG